MAPGLNQPPAWYYDSTEKEDTKPCHSTRSSGTMKRIIRNQRLTPENAAKYKVVRGQISAELPDLIARYHERMAAHDQLQALLGAA